MYGGQHQTIQDVEYMGKHVFINLHTGNGYDNVHTAIRLY